MRTHLPRSPPPTAYAMLARCRRHPHLRLREVAERGSSGPDLATLHQDSTLDLSPPLPLSLFWFLSLSSLFLQLSLDTRVEPPPERRRGVRVVRPRAYRRPDPDAVEGKLPEEIRRHYELLVEDVDGIEGGRLPLLVYAGSGGPEEGGSGGSGGPWRRAPLHKKVTLTRPKAGVERLAFSLDLYNQGSACIPCGHCTTDCA